MKSILVTGCAGFIGSNFCKFVKTYHPELKIIGIDKKTYAARKDTEWIQFTDKFYRQDILQTSTIRDVVNKYHVDTIFHFAAESHVNNSVDDPKLFTSTNILGTQSLLEVIRNTSIRFVHISTDEVYGSINNGSFVESDRFNPSSPYAYSKASAEHLVSSYRQTYGIDTVVVRPTNNFGYGQHKEKFIPRSIELVMQDYPITIHGDGTQERDWLWVNDTCYYVYSLALLAKSGGIYNLAGNSPRNILHVTKTLLRLLDAVETFYEYIPDRQVNDYRYSISNNLLFTDFPELKRECPTDFETNMSFTVQEYRRNYRNE